MSVYIPGMEMPKHCGECGIEWCERWKNLIVAGMPIAKSRPSDCPLVPVPDHGRLIDADALEKELGIMWQEDDDASFANHSVWKAVHSGPTIIPADPAKEGEE